MSTMILFTYDDGEQVATVSWSAEFGWVKAGDREILDRITVEERPSRQIGGTSHSVSAPKPVATTVTPALDEDDPYGDEAKPGRCFSCGCPQEAHEDGACERHGCRSFVP